MVGERIGAPKTGDSQTTATQSQGGAEERRSDQYGPEHSRVEYRLYGNINRRFLTANVLADLLRSSRSRTSVGGCGRSIIDLPIE